MHAQSHTQSVYRCTLTLNGKPLRLGYWEWCVGIRFNVRRRVIIIVASIDEILLHLLNTSTRTSTADFMTVYLLVVYE